MKKFSFYGFMAGQIFFVLLIELIFFNDLILASLTEHIIIAICVFIITALSYYISKRMINSDPGYMIHTVIGSTTVKLIVYIVMIAGLLYFFDGPRMAYVFFFFITYILVTTTEIVSLVRSLRNTRATSG